MTAVPAELVAPVCNDQKPARGEVDRRHAALVPRPRHLRRAARYFTNDYGSKVNGSRERQRPASDLGADALR